MLTRALLTIGMLTLSGCGCGDDDDDDTTGGPLPAVAEIGPEGGTFTIGGLTGTVPPGAAEEGATLVIRGEVSDDATPPDGAIGPVYEIVIEGVLREPVTLELPYEDGALGGRLPLALRVASSPDGIAWNCDPMIAPRQEPGAVMAVTMHASFWVLRFLGCDDDGDCTAPEQCFDLRALPGRRSGSAQLQRRRPDAVRLRLAREHPRWARLDVDGHRGLRQLPGSAPRRRK